MLDSVIVEHLLMLHFVEEFGVSDLAKYQIASNKEKSHGVRNWIKTDVKSLDLKYYLINWWMYGRLI